MAMNSGQRTVRRLTGLLPLIVVGALFAAPVVIWLVKRDPPVIDEIRTRGRVMAATLGEKSMPVMLEDGSVVFVPAPDAAPKPGTEVMVVRQKLPGGTESLSLESP